MHLLFSTKFVPYMVGVILHTFIPARGFNAVDFIDVSIPSELSPTEMHPTVRIAHGVHETAEHLELLRESLNGAGLVVTSGESVRDENTAKPSYDVLWVFEPTDMPVANEISPGRLLNHIPGVHRRQFVLSRYIGRWACFFPDLHNSHLEKATL